jgi:lipopolysaccharide/colanic/teichoic acid biosynthesis glycosyltransferase
MWSKELWFGKLRKRREVEKFDVPQALMQPSQKYIVFKRVLDILFSSVGILVLLPVLLITFLLVKLDGGPAFFRQKRVGKDGRVFTIYKFRSMCVNAEERLKELECQNEIEGLMFKMKDDPRITRVGHFIRKTSIDELPQLWNVLIGDMSMVGPRPPLTREVEQYSTYHKKRLTVTPGCSGLWQVSGRNELNFEQMVDLDIEYIKHQTIKQDLSIIWKTIVMILNALFRGKKSGAY